MFGHLWAADLGEPVLAEEPGLGMPGLVEGSPEQVVQALR